MSSKSKKLKTTLIILALLLAVSSCLLVGRIIYLNYFAERGTTVIVPDNIIGKDSEDALAETDIDTEPGTEIEGEKPQNNGTADNTGADTEVKKAATLALTRLNSDDNIPFKAENMLPGDLVTKYYRVKVTHSGDVILYFSTEVKKQLKSLGDVLNIKITHLETDNTLYSGPFNGMSDKGYSEKISKSEKGETYAYYRVDAFLDTSVGNEYQVASLLADFNWYVEDDDNMSSPTTGDSLSTAALVAMIAAFFAALVILLILVFSKKKEKEDAR